MWLGTKKCPKANFAIQDNKKEGKPQVQEKDPGRRKGVDFFYGKKRENYHTICAFSM